MSRSTGAAVAAQPAAAVVLLRDAPRGCETLLLRRNVTLSFHGGAWVFPGGRVDRGDVVEASEPAGTVGAARRAAVREVLEESGLSVAGGELVVFSRWVTPEGEPKRFDAWYFVAAATPGEVRVDGGEIVEHVWIPAREALAAHARGEFDLPPPTWVTLSRFADLHSVDSALSAASSWPLDHFRPRMHLLHDGACCLYEGDAAYESGEVDTQGTRHRLWMRDCGWQYQRDPHTPGRPRIP